MNTTTATPELQIEPKLPVLAFNFDQLKAWAESLTERYTNMVVGEDALVEVKKDMADLNKNKAKLEEARKEVVRRVSEPIRGFEAQIKEVVGIFDAAYAGLSGQVKAFEEAQRNEKRKVVEGIIKEECNAAYGEGPRLHIPVQDSWLNKSAGLKTVREAVAAIIEKDLEEERRRKALEQARQDRAAAIESHVKGLNEKHGLNMSLSLFIGNPHFGLDIPLTRAISGIEEVFAVELELRQAEESARKTLASVSEQKAAPVEQTAPKVEQTAPKIEQQASQPETRAMSIVLEYDTANEPRVQACLATLKTLCVNFGARYR